MNNHNNKPKKPKRIANSLKGGLTYDVLERRNSCLNHRPDWSTEGMGKMVQRPETVENVLAIGQIQRRNEWLMPWRSVSWKLLHPGGSRQGLNMHISSSRELAQSLMRLKEILRQFRCGFSYKLERRKISINPHVYLSKGEYQSSLYSINLICLPI